MEYSDKLQLINGVDPYSLSLKDFDASLDEVPKISKNIMMDYLLFRTSSTTNKEIRAFKSLDAFAQFACKWIEQMAAKKVGENFVVFAKIRHSQRVSEPPLKAWIILDGKTILGCHCTCVAGLSEVCTHIAAILFSLQFANSESSLHDEKSVTDVLAYWIGPSKKGQFHQRLADIDFSMPRTLLEPSAGTSKKRSYNVHIPSLSSDEVSSFHRKIKELGVITASMLGKTELQSNNSSPDLPPYMTEFFKEEYTFLNLDELRSLARELCLSFTKDQADKVYNDTKKQSECDLWFDMRGGRITASNFYAVCRTSLEKPSVSLVKKVCYPKMEKKLFTAGVYGCKHEKDALTAFISNHQNMHESAILEKCGLILNPKYPYFGCTPDSMLQCTECTECGLGCVEVKCPFCVRDSSVADLVEFKSACIDRNFSLRKNHAYYYQVQMQMAMTETSFCFFVVWSQKDFFVQKLYFDEELWESANEKATTFFDVVIMPEILGKYYTRNSSTQLEHKSKTTAGCSYLSDQPLSMSAGSNVTKNTSPMAGCSHETREKMEYSSSNWCYCQQSDDGSMMVMCGSENCRIQWFHRRCIPLKTLPKGKWFCKACKGKTTKAK